MDTRQALVHRNQQLAQAFHQDPVKHMIRRKLIHLSAYVPFAPLTTRTQRILFIKPDHIGDMLLATPAIRAVKDALPFAEIHVLAGHWSAGILANFDEIDRVLTYSFPGFNRHDPVRNPLTPYLEIVRVSRQLRAIGYQSAVILRPDHWWGAMLAHVSGIQQRIGYDLPDVAPFLTQIVPYESTHVVLQAMRLVEHWIHHNDPADIKLTLPVDDDSRDFARQFLRQSKLNKDQHFICIHAGAGSRYKQWDAEKWASVADTLSEQMGITIVFTGVDHERSLIARIQNQMTFKSINAAGELSLMQLAALYAQAEAVIGCDSGPLHMAAAVKTPTVTLFGPADPSEFGTWGDPKQHEIMTSPIGCRPCRVLDWGDDALENHPCISEIHIGAVLEATRRVIHHKQDDE